MGKRNDEFAWYMNKAAVLADFLNGSLYDGKKVIFPEELAEFQKTYQKNRRDRSGRIRRPRRERDVVKLLCRKGHFILLAVENQDNPNLCMPLRCMEYDVEDFTRQLRRLKKHYEMEGGLKKGVEYLLGIKRTDRLIPVVTIVLYHGKGTWEAPEQLSDMLDMDGMDDTLKSLQMNYRIQIVNLTDLKEDNFETGLRELVGMMKRKDDKLAMETYCRENAERFRNMDDDTYDMIPSVNKGIHGLNSPNLGSCFVTFTPRTSLYASISCLAGVKIRTVQTLRPRPMIFVRFQGG